MKEQEGDCEEPAWILRRVPNLMAFCEKVVAVSLVERKAVMFPDRDFRKTFDTVSDNEIGEIWTG